jgi:surface protein
MVCLLWAVTVLFEQRVPPSAFLFLRVYCACNRPSFLPTVFEFASAFNGDLNQWDVGKVTSMDESKSMRIVENYFT